MPGFAFGYAVAFFHLSLRLRRKMACQGVVLDLVMA